MRFLVLALALALGGCAVIEDHVEVPYRSVTNVAPLAGAQTVVVNVTSRDGSPGSNISLDRSQLDAIWPLKVGKKVTFRSSNDNSLWEHQVRVLRKEVLSLPTGPTETYVVERHQIGMASSTYDAQYTYWYAPALRMVVKFDLKLNSGTAPPLDQSWDAREIVIPAKDRAAS